MEWALEGVNQEIFGFGQEMDAFYMRIGDGGQGLKVIGHSKSLQPIGCRMKYYGSQSDLRLDTSLQEVH